MLQLSATLCGESVLSIFYLARPCTLHYDKLHRHYGRRPPLQKLVELLIDVKLAGNSNLEFATTAATAVQAKTL